MAFDAAERNGKFGCLQCQGSKESNSRGKRKGRVFLCRRTVRVKVKGQVMPTSFLKIEGRRTFLWAKEGQLIELVGDQNPGPEVPPRSKRGGSKGKVKGGAAARGAKKSRCIKVIEGEGVRRDNPIEYFLSTGVGSTL